MRCAFARGGARAAGLGLIAATSLLPAAPAEPASVCALGSRRELFVDRYLIDRLDRTQLRLNHPIDMGSVLAFDSPWDGLYSTFVTVIQDGPKYRMYYAGKPTLRPSGSDDETTCYAESSDGIDWAKPDLGLFEVKGTRKNNVILEGSTAPMSTAFSPFLDLRPGVPAAERYKALSGRFDGVVGKDHSVRSSGGLLAMMSPDGIHWHKVSPRAVISRANYPYSADSSLYPAFWSESEQCYVAYIRTRTSLEDAARARAHPGMRVTPHDSGAMRWIGRVTSADFVHWSQVEMMDYDTPELEQIYNNATSPYFRAPHLYLGLAARIVFDRPVVTREQAVAIGVAPSHANDASEAVLFTSRGGAHYDRVFLEALIRNRIGPENWISRSNFCALNIVPTGATEMSLYVDEAYGLSTCHLERYRLDTDRLASVNAPLRGGEMLTRLLTFSGKNLLINLSTSVAGGIRVEIQDAAGRPIPGFALADAVETIGNDIERRVAWKGGADVSRLSGQPVRLRFVMAEADLYALRFR